MGNPETHRIIGEDRVAHSKDKCVHIFQLDADDFLNFGNLLF
jgi:hypothetical protein